MSNLRLVIFDTLDHSDEETWPDQKPSYLHTYPPTNFPLESTIKEQFRDLYLTLGSWLYSPVEQMTPSPSLPPQLSEV